MIKRIFDLFFSLLALIILSPAFVIIGLWVLLESPGGMFFRQERMGKDFRIFKLYKFRSMRPGSDAKGLLTIGGRDPRITRSGYFIRKYKVDELPQLINILKGDMCLVGPRPEVKRYTDMYNETQKQVLSVRPGLTDYASILYFNESDLLSQSANPEKTYIEEIMPAKLALNLKYISEQNFKTDLSIIAKTIQRIFS
jgi:lipopolysaccharide/colanic/teichoic acid biosynthesis glycosyltransferase